MKRHVCAAVLLAALLCLAGCERQPPDELASGLAAFEAGDWAGAADQLDKAAAHRDAVAQYHLAELYESGRGVRQDYRTAAKWYRTAATAQHPEAQYRLGWMMAYGRGTPKDPAQAHEWWLKAAAQGVPEAQRIVGYLYVHGVGVEQSTKRGLGWLQKAANQGYAQARLDLEQYDAGTANVEKSPTEASTPVTIGAPPGPSSR